MIALLLAIGEAAAYASPRPIADDRVTSPDMTATPRAAEPRARMRLLGLRHSDHRLDFHAVGSGIVSVVIIGDPSPAALEGAGAELVTSGEGFFTARLAEASLGRLAAVPGVRTLQISRREDPELDVSATMVGATAVHGSSAPPWNGYTGKNVVFGLVDTGIDWTHGDFRDLAGHSRILYMWDETDATGPHPALYPYGSEWTRAQIEAPGTCREVDTQGHGTHVGSIGAGNGAATGNGKPPYTYVGMAPEADLVVVKTDFSNTGVIDGVSWIFQKATQLGKDAVVNLSLGSNYGPHDGTDPEEIALDALSGPGRIIVKAAGNSAGEKRHGKVMVKPGLTATVSWTVSNYTPSQQNYNYFDLDAWYSDQDSLTFTLLSPNGQTLGPVPVGYYTPQAVSTPDGALYGENGTQLTQNGLRHLFIEVWDPQIGQAPAVGTWTLRLDNTRSVPAQFDSWLAGYNLGDGMGAATTSANWDSTGDITTPGTGHKVITVGAFTTKGCWKALGYAHTLCYVANPAPGGIAFFSSRGPTRDGRMKPELCAPGFGVAGALSGSTTAPAGFTVEDGVHMIDQGTSMACPHVAGALCVMLQRYPHMGPSEALTRLTLGAVRDSAVGATPNNTWGWGKLSLAGAMATPAAVDGPSSPAPLAMEAGPNPFRGRAAVRVSFARRGQAKVRVLDVAGRSVRTLHDGVVEPGTREFLWDGTREGRIRCASGIYWVEVSQDGARDRKRLTLVR